MAVATRSDKSERQRRGRKREADGPVLGKPVVQHNLDLLAEAGLDEAHVNIHYLAGAELDHYGQGEARGWTAWGSVPPARIGSWGLQEA
jgi:hypothetical protein